MMAKEPKVGKYIDEEEKNLIEALEADDAVFVSVLTPKRKKEIQAIARATMNPVREKITLRISRNDLMRLKSKAMQEGMPYQTLIGSILHKAVS
jgi:predicted DNA binding CopG/RHH family protein